MPPAVAPQEAGSVSGSSFGSSVGGSSFHPFQPQRIIPDEDRYAIHQSSASASSSSSSSSTHTGTAAQPVARRKGVLSQILAASNNALANTGSQTSAQQRHAPGCKRTKSHDALCCVGGRASAAGASGATGGKYGPMPFARSKSWTEVDGGRSTAPGSPMSDGNMLVDKRFMLNFGNGADEDMPSVELHKCRHCSKLYPRTISNSSWTLPHEDPSKFFFCSGECYLTQAVIHAKRNPM
ncbi:Hypothetical Protein FCC1311_008412 [Hondaea fermentalgiana]|uniref:Uncharacterized protein n=1 Tax=Hondaea fermentalgiana TaxID=2315210 RepID=A0A2R5G0T9_9STRA|nr:Hypothetical Protein FCC1311_008412 [Hondaea fermentalgiana]|eukprot:GBG24622.1 Hypothetical Protein FCC1311_008412 [Hondaea fermentalgiana]